MKFLLLVCNLNFFRRIFFLTAKIFFVSSIITTAGCSSKIEREAYYLAQAKAQIEKNQLEEARKNIGNVLQINQRNHEAYFYLGHIQEARKQYRKAMVHYTQALEIMPSFTPAKTDLARLQMMFGQTAQAGSKAGEMLKSDPQDTSVKALVAEISASEESFDKVVEKLEEARKTKSNSQELYSELSELYLRQGNIPKAESVLFEANERFPQSILFRTLQAQVYTLTNKPSKVEQSLQSIIAIEPNEFNHRAKLAAHYVAARQIEKAESTLHESVAAAPKEVKRVIALAEFLLRHRSSEAAESELKNYIQALPNSFDLRFALAEIYETTGNLIEAENIYHSIIAQYAGNAEDEKAHTKLAQMYASMGKAGVAKTHATKALKISRNSPDALAARGRIALEEGDLERAIADFRSALKQNPVSEEYLDLLSYAHLRNKEPSLSRELLFRAAKNNPNNIFIRTLLVEFLIKARDDESAVKELEAMEKMFPFDPIIAKLQQRADAVLKAPPGSAATSADEDVFSFSAKAAIHYKSGNQYIRQHKYDDAIGEFQKSLRFVPTAVDPLYGIVEAHLAQGRPDLAQAKVNTLLRINSPVLHHAYYLLGQINIAQNKAPQAIRAYQRALDINPNWEAPYLALAQHFTNLREYKQAQSVLETAARKIPENMTIALHLAGVFELNQSYNFAIAEYEKLLAANPEQEIVANNLAVLLIDRLNNKTSIERALTLARRFEKSSQSEYLDTLGWALVKSGQVRRGLPYLEKALTMNPEAHSYHYHTGYAYKKIGDKGKAKTHLLMAISPGPSFSGREQAKALVAQF
jgi:tetratricopeptide (TPR) repeat protein